MGSPLDVIASGPTVPDTSTFADALAVLDQIADRVPESIRRHLPAGAAGEIPDTPKTLPPMQNVIVADNAVAAQAALERAESLGSSCAAAVHLYRRGGARGRESAGGAGTRDRRSDRPAARPACVILGGETTVTVRGSGKGGRNQELALAAALAIQGMENVIITSLATDGSDGPTDAAGGMVDGTTTARGSALGLSAQAALDQNDAYPYLARVGDLLITGPTNTNVNDLMVVCVW